MLNEPPRNTRPARLITSLVTIDDGMTIFTPWIKTKDILAPQIHISVDVKHSQVIWLEAADGPGALFCTRTC